MQFADYDSSILSLASSIMEHFNVRHNHKTIPELDLLLSKGYKNVFVILFDGLGIDALENHLPPDAFLRKNLLKEISSVFPPTTTAATTSVLTGLSPAEHGWLGWSLYFEEIDKNVDLFPNSDENGEAAADYNVARRYLPAKNIPSLINETGTAKGYINSQNGISSNNYKKMMRQLVRFSRRPGKKYVYCYSSQPDSLMHMTGCSSDETHKKILEINSISERIAKKLKNTLLIITADHGLIDTHDSHCISEYPELTETLERLPSIEPRTLNCYVKSGMSEKFLEVCTKEFGDKVCVLSKREAIENRIFGDASDNAVLEKRLGDYLIISKSDLTLFNSPQNVSRFIGIHAGIDKRELKVPLIAVEKGK